MSAKKPTYFGKEKFSPFSPPIVTLLSCLNSSLDGNGSSAIHASSKGLRITLNGRTIASGKTPTELHTAFQALCEDARRKSTD